MERPTPCLFGRTSPSERTSGKESSPNRDDNKQTATSVLAAFGFWAQQLRADSARHGGKAESESDCSSEASSSSRSKGSSTTSTDPSSETSSRSWVYSRDCEPIHFALDEQCPIDSRVEEGMLGLFVIAPVPRRVERRRVVVRL
mmetsp:Transcript_45241/g.121103  ORF Transcript_45241/g.121103 Transcript_45241/m.121103 type:complete len:144 (-) Transcript_45241:116-547(-)